MTAQHQIKPTTHCCQSAWQPNLGRRSTYRRGKSVQTTGTTSADLKRVHFIANVATNGSKRPFNPASDIKVLCDKLKEHSEVRLIIIDPLVAAIKGDGHKNSEVRRDLLNLAILADERGIAILGITHLNKGGRKARLLWTE